MYSAPETQCAVDGSALYGPKAEARVGQTIGNYELLSIIGVGGMGVVYKGQHAILEKPVAVKVLNERFAQREGGIDQFLREAKAATRTRHPNIVDVTDFGTAPDGSVYFVMEFLEGVSLEDILARDGAIELFNAVNIVRQIGHALAAAHQEGIIHRDLKPENIFLINREGRRRVVRRQTDGSFSVEKESAFDFVKLLDFGVAKYTLDDVGPSYTTRAGMIFGTPQYMSPEQARGEPVDARSDVYALGVLFYEMITGAVPFDGDNALDILNGHVSGIPVPPSQKNPNVHVDQGTDRTILKCLEKDPANRLQSMEALVEGLLECFTDQVFLRDAHMMPGALEAGIVPPPVTGGAQMQPVSGKLKPRVAAGRSKSITDELGELFSKSSTPNNLEQALESALATENAPPKERREVRPLSSEQTKTSSAPEPRSRKATNKGIGVFKGPEEKSKTKPFGSGDR